MNTQKFGLQFTKEQNFNGWYVDVLLSADLIDLYCIRGFTIMRPNSFFLWKQIQKFIDGSIMSQNVKEAYFPLVIPQKYLEIEKNHLNNFEPEVCWITKSGEKDIPKIAVRPTSETIMYPHFRTWIRSLRDLPMKLNQWCNVLRWEVKSTLPFIRGREFLWQEGHCAYLSSEECLNDTLSFLDMYERVYEDLLAIPVVKGKKTESEKFGGAEGSYSVEAFIRSAGRAVQAATSHFLGQNFSKMFDIKVETVRSEGEEGDKKIKKKDIQRAIVSPTDGSASLCIPKEKRSVGSENNSPLKLPIDSGNSSQQKMTENKNPIQQPQSVKNSDVCPKRPNQAEYTHVYQNSWGFTTRSLGIAIMTHSDNIGAVLPPRIAPTQVIIINCGKLTTDLQSYIQNIMQELNAAEIRCEFDDRVKITTGYKYNYHEIRGTPFRFEIGKTELENRSVTVYKRFSGHKVKVSFDDLTNTMKNMINESHDEMLQKARKDLVECTKSAATLEELIRVVEDRMMCLASWCGLEECEDVIKEKTAVLDDKTSNVILTGAKSLCIPFDYMREEKKNCVVCGKKGEHTVLFGRSY